MPSALAIKANAASKSAGRSYANAAAFMRPIFPPRAPPE
jgi:hypothetical protein